MATIPLRSYTSEIEKLIENGQVPEAIAHCRHILKFYPKHIDTYRLLGKAFLETQRYSEAGDILQRVLSVIPDDFISQIGMSIIREDERDLDGAIYHMERAFEVQPSNVAIQNELRRLYGRRDGVEPPKIRLTRGALVRMYARGELYPQAIAETRSALTEDPQRIDLQVILARLYFLSGQKVQAAETASKLVSKLPYCYEANRILADVLPGTARADDTKVYLERLRALDPYSAFISDNSPTSASVPDQTVQIERLDYQAAQQESLQPEWTRTAGVAWEESPAAEETVPDWMTGEAAKEPEPSAPGPELEQTPAPEVARADEIPDWMTAAGWSPSSGDAVETPVNFEESGEELEAQSAEIPDWLKELAPQATPEMPQSPAEDDEKWLEGIIGAGAGVAAGEALLSTENEEPAQAKTPAMENQLVEPPVAETPVSPAMTTLPVEETPPVAEEKLSEEIPAAEQTLPSEEHIAEAETTISTVASEAETKSPMEAEAITPEADMDSAMAWLEALAAKQGAVEGTLLTQPDERAEEMPDWLKKEAEAGGAVIPEEKIAAEIPSSNIEEVAEVPTSEIPQGLETPAPEESAVIEPALTGEPVDQTVHAEESAMGTSAEESFGELPDWLVGLGEAAASSELTGIAEPAKEAEPVSSEETIAPITAEKTAEPIQSENQPEVQPAAAELPADLRGEEKQAEEVSPVGTEDIDSAIAWLESLAAKQGAVEGTLLTNPEDRRETPPAWTQMEESQTASPENVPSVQAAPVISEEPKGEETIVQPEEVSPPEKLPSIAVVEASSTEEAALPPVPEVAQLPVEETEAEMPETTPAPSEELQESPAAQEWRPEEAFSADKTQPVNVTPPAEAAHEPGPAPTPEAVEETAHEESESAGWLAEPEQPAVEAGETLPEWLQDLGNYPAIPAVPEAAGSETPMPTWLKDFEEPAAEQPKAQPFQELNQSVWTSETQPETSSLQAETAPVQPAAEPETAVPSKVEPQEMSSTVESPQAVFTPSEEPGSVLSLGQQALRKGEIDQALTYFDQLTQSGDHLEETIHDLRDALDRFPVNTNIWQSLGDAYLRSNRIQDALDAYTKAEELLR